MAPPAPPKEDAARPAGSRRLQLLFVILVTAAIAGTLGAIIATRARARDGEIAPVAPVAAQYVCPMHPSIVQNHPGTCPICGMKLVREGGPSGDSRRPLFYRSPMDPQQTSPVPAKDSMGMDYVAVYEESTSTASEVDGLVAVSIDVSRQQLIGLRTAAVDRGTIDRTLRTVGRVSVDETRVRRVNVKVSGYVERVFLDFVGKPVRKGQPLFSFYSPEVLAAESELLVAQRSREGSSTLVAAARRKLELWDVPETELQRLEREGVAARAVTFVSPASGVVTKKDLVEGTHLEAGAMPYEIVDLSSVWVLADVYETELRFVAPGMPASLHLNAFPERTYTGTVLFVDPVLDANTRTARVRLAFPNLNGDLRPELFGEVTLERPPREVVRVASDALVHSGTGHVAFVALAEGRFEPRRVQVGESGRDYTEVLAGLHEGELVVTRANFLVDSESSLRASLARIAKGPLDAATTPGAAQEAQ